MHGLRHGIESLHPKAAEFHDLAAQAHRTGLLRSITKEPITGPEIGIWNERARPQARLSSCTRSAH